MIEMKYDPRSRLIEVCASCHMASCWHGIFHCDEFRTAGTVVKTAEELDKLGLENKRYYSAESIKEITGCDPTYLKEKNE